MLGSCHVDVLNTEGITHQNADIGSEILLPCADTLLNTLHLTITVKAERCNRTVR